MLHALDLARFLIDLFQRNSYQSPSCRDDKTSSSQAWFFQSYLSGLYFPVSIVVVFECRQKDIGAK